MKRESVDNVGLDALEIQDTTRRDERDTLDADVLERQRYDDF